MIIHTENQEYEYEVQYAYQDEGKEEGQIYDHHKDRCSGCMECFGLSWRDFV